MMKNGIIVVLGVFIIALSINTKTWAQDFVGDFDVTGRVNAGDDFQVTTNDKSFRIKTNSGALRTMLRCDSTNLVRIGSPNAEMGNLRFQVGNNSQALEIEATTGNVTCSGEMSVSVLEIRGAGMDLAEGFVVNSNGHEVQPGMVVAIDPSNPGQLTVATEPYQKTVAGIISGAGDKRVGIQLGNAEEVAKGDLTPVALTGQVWAWVDASFGAVQPGDLLTTSPTAGHAMKADDPNRAMGAVIGKAMTPLKSGKGLVLVLVNLH